MAAMARPFTGFSKLLRSKRGFLLINQLHNHSPAPCRYLSSTPATCAISRRGGTVKSTTPTSGLMGRFERQLKTKYPKLHTVYLLMKEGLIDFYIDTKTLMKVSKEIRKGTRLTKFSYYELDVYRQMPRDLLRFGPVVVLLNIPVTDLIIPPLVFLYPRHLLSRHFWTADQHSEFGELSLRGRLEVFPKVLQGMEEQAVKVQDPGQRRALENILSKLEHDAVPSVEEIVDIQSVFKDGQPFGQTALTQQHKSNLSKSMGFSSSGFRLSPKVFLLHHLDMAIDRELVRSLSPLQIKEACFLRGLNAKTCTKEQSIDYLNSWIAVSKHVDESSLSLLLHSPVLLGMNHPSNSHLRTGLKS